jgi:hypothetical protein
MIDNTLSIASERDGNEHIIQKITEADLPFLNETRNAYAEEFLR